MYYISTYKTCNEVVRGEETVKNSRAKARLKWRYKLATTSEDWYPEQLFME